MIDNITIRTRFTNDEFIKFLLVMGWNIKIDSEKVKFKYGNLFWVYYPNTGHLTISNSLHKFYNLEFNDLLHEAINYNDFSFSALLTVVHYLSELLERNPEELIISSRFEFGLNIYTDTYKPFEVISKYQSIVSTHSNEFFTVSPYHGKPIQRSCYFSDWNVKAYDKAKQVGLINANLLRFEIVVTELRKLRNIFGTSAISLRDVCDLTAWNKMFEFLLSTYDKIRKIPQLELSSITNEELYAIYAYCNKLFRDDLQRNNSKYFFKLLNNKNKLIYERHNLSDINYHNTVRAKMIDKYQSLLPAGSS